MSLPPPPSAGDLAIVQLQLARNLIDTARRFLAQSPELEDVELLIAGGLADGYLVLGDLSSLLAGLIAQLRTALGSEDDCGS